MIGPRVLEMVKQRGPIIPSDISKDINMNTLITSAILAELVSNKQLKLTSLKYGGTPMYYAPGQEEKLQEYSRFLHAKDKEAYALLKTELVLRDSTLEPITRVALREIKDFAFPLEVIANGSKEIFWRWYLMSNEDAEPKIKNLLGLERPKEVIAEKQEVVRPAEVKPQATLDKPTPVVTHTPAIEKPAQIIEPQVKKVAPKKRVVRPKKDSGAFITKVINFFSTNNIEILQKIDAKKKTEADFLISVPSPVGSVRYYCKAKDKKNSNEGDLSTAFVVGQSKQLPVLYLTNGKLTKKASSMMENEFKTMNFKQI